MQPANPTALLALPSGQTPPLAHWGVIRATGADAAVFLQGQLTQDVLNLGLGQSRLAAYCSAKGRMLASFWVLKRLDSAGQPEFLMVCSRDILAQTVKRLNMFVLRAKVKLSDASGEFELRGVVGPAPVGGFSGLAAISLPPASAGPANEAAARSTPRWLVLTANAAVNQAAVQNAEGLGGGETGVAALVESAAAPVAADTWQWLDVQSGVAMITLPTVEAFVPQMLNYESVGGVNFKKGCYPGQEVVARSQFRGTLKRRAYLVHSEAPMAAGDLVFGPADAEQACGTVVQSAAAPQGGFDAIVSMQVAAAEQGGLTSKAPGGPALGLKPLPYALLEDI